jgi:phosphoribosylglycinamide formyltransferase-1
MNFVVLCSSKGTVFQAVIDKMKDGNLSKKCLGLITDRTDRGCVQKAMTAELPIIIVEKEKTETREAYEKKIESALERLHVTEETIIACMGWMWILSPSFVTHYKNRILNVHPSLLPKHSGAHAHAEVLASGDRESGMTIHLIDEGVDTGKILLQKTCPVLPDDTEATLRERVQALECEWYPKVLQTF